MVLSPDRTSESPMELLKQSVSGPALQSEFVGLGDPSIRSFKSSPGGNSLVVQWLGLRALNAEGVGSVPGWGSKIPQTVQHGPNK